MSVLGEWKNNTDEKNGGEYSKTLLRHVKFVLYLFGREFY